MRVKGAVTPSVADGGFTGSGFLAYLSLTMVITKGEISPLVMQMLNGSSLG